MNEIFAKVIIFCFACFIPIDMINGILIQNDILSISLVYKAVVLILVSLFLVKFLRIIPLFIFFCVIVLYVFIHSYLTDLDNAIESQIMIIRFISIIVFYYFFSILVRQKKDKLLFTVVNVSFLFLALNILLGAIGYGCPMYENKNLEIGTRGLIYSGNEISGAFITAGALIMMKSIEQNRYINFFFIGAIMLGISVLMTTKVSIIGSLILFITFPLLKIIKQLKKLRISKKDFLLLSFFPIFVPVNVIISLYFGIYKSNIITKMLYTYNKSDFITSVLSNRNVWASEAMNAYMSEYSTTEIFFGSGLEWQKYISGNKFVEIGIIDFLMTYGLIGLMIISGTIFIILWKTLICRNKNPYFIYIIFIILMLIGISCTSGHIFYSGTSGFLIAIVFALGQKKC